MLGRQSFVTILVGKSILLREGLARILRSTSFRVLASVSSADDSLASKLQQSQPLFIVVHTGDDFDTTLEQIERFREQHLGGRIAIVADHFRPEEMVSAFRAGANGYFVDMTSAAFIKSLELVMMGETIFPLAFLSFVLDSEHEHLCEAVPCDENNKAIFVTPEDALAPQLSSREESVLRCLIKGDSNKCIARKMDIAEATVKVHVKAILRKIRVHNRTQAAIWGANHGSLTRAANNSSPLVTSDVSKPLPKPVTVIPEIKQIEASEPSSLIEDANHVDEARIDHLFRKGINRRTHGTARLGK
jgi:two-component system nitrate/nitrite response regulator NarL